MKMLSAAIVAAIMALVLSACAVLDEISKNELAAQIIVNQSTIRVIEAADDPIARRDRVRELVAAARDYVDRSAEATVAELDERIRAEIRWDRMGVADQELIDLVLRRARSDLERAVGDGLLEEDERLVIVMVLRWIDQAAQRVR